MNRASSIPHLIDGRFLIGSWCPNLLRAFPPTAREWKQVNDKLTRRVQLQMEHIVAEGPVQVGTCIFDLALRASFHNDRFARCMLQWLDRSIGVELAVLVGERPKASLRKVVFQLISAFAPFESYYLDRLGELLALHRIVSSKAAQLAKVERRLENRKGVDYLLTLPSGVPVFLEISNKRVNHLRVESADGFASFLSTHANKKLLDEFAGVDVAGLGGPALLFVVLWLDLAHFVPYREVFARLEKEMPHVRFLTLMQRGTADRSFFTFEMAEIGSAIDRWKIEKAA